MTINRQSECLVRGPEDYWKYLVFGYRATNSYTDNRYSELDITKTDNVDEVATVLYWYEKDENVDWEVYILVNGKPRHVNDFRLNINKYAIEVEQRAAERKKRIEEETRRSEEESKKRQEEHDKAEWERLKSKFGSTQ